LRRFVREGIVPTMRPSYRGALLFGVACLTAASAHAQPTVTICAESRLELDVRSADDGLDVTGALRDDLGIPLVGEEISLELSEGHPDDRSRGSHITTRTVQTGPDGAFALRFEVASGDYVVDAAFGGSAEHLAITATRFFDLDRAHLSLRLGFVDGASLDLTRSEHDLQITARSDRGGTGLAMDVLDERGTTLGHGVTEPIAGSTDGSLRIRIASALLGPPSSGRIVVRTSGDRDRAEAQSELPVVRFRPTHTTLTLSRTAIDPRERVLANGRLDDGVDPLPHEAIGLFAGDTLVGTALTDEAGHFELQLAGDDLGDVEDGAVAVVARYASSAPWRPGSESPSITLTIARPTSLGWLWALVAVLASSAVALWSLRTGPGAPQRVARHEGVAGIALGARRVLAPSRTEIHGVVLDAISSEPIVGARVAVAGAETTTDARGSFVLAPPRGAAELRVESSEHLTLRTAIAVPHRGEHEGMQIRLGSRRAASFVPLRKLAGELADQEIAPALTQREVIEVLRARGASPPALPALVARVEVACYGERAPDDEEIAAIQASAAAMSEAAERARRVA
jgi:hypothetical protein